MTDLNDADVYAERAEMHEQLAAATSDTPARKMHLAMAAEYRRKSSELGAGAIGAMSLGQNGGASLLMVDHG